MTILKINSDVTQGQFAKMVKDWDTHSDVGVVVSESLTADQIDAVLKMATARLPHEFSYGVMGCLAELPEASDEALAEIFMLGDIACKEAVCLRPVKTDAISQLCSTYGAQHSQSHRLIIE